MKRKLYAKYNRRSKLIEFTFIGVNDDEAIYNYTMANMKAENENPFYNSEDYRLICLGVLNMEGEAKDVGIIYDYKDDFNVVFDEIEDGKKPKYNQSYFENIQAKKEREKEIIDNSRGLNRRDKWTH